MRIARFGGCAIGDAACDALLDAVRAPTAALRLLGLERNPRISAPKHEAVARALRDQLIKRAIDAAYRDAADVSRGRIRLAASHLRPDHLPWVRGAVSRRPWRTSQTPECTL